MLCSAFLISGIWFSTPLFSQQPTKQEMDEMKKMIEQVKADPEMQKAMKQMGMDSNTLEKMMNNNQTSDMGSYYEFDEFQTPKKDMARIGSVPKQPLTNAALSSYLRNVEKCVDASLSVENRPMVDLLYSKAKTNADLLANMASGLWISKSYIPAVYLMGKAAQQNANVTNLNNYAALLVMTGGEELALPLLQKLNRENPKNSTILNNIGQAWFGLGDLNQAARYLDSTLVIVATHSQANQTKCVIQESKGDKAGAIQSMKQSVKGSYTPTKEAMLRKLGYKLDGKDLNDSDLHMPTDPLGFEKWMETIPPFPRDYKEQMLLAQRWKDFYRNIQDEQTKLQEKAGRLNIEYADSLVKRQKKFMANPLQNQFKEPYLSSKASKVLKYYTDDKDGHNAAESKKIAEAMTNTYADLERYKADAYQKHEQLKRKYYDSIGEGQKSQGGDMCQEVIEVYNSWINTSNTVLESYMEDYLKFKAKRLEANAYYTQYIIDLQPAIDFNETSMKLAFLVDLSNIRPLLDYQSEFAWGCIESELKKEHEETNKLADWDDLHCDKNITFSVPFTGSFQFTCNSTTVNLDPLILPFQASFEQNLNTRDFVNATGSFGYGPVKAGGDYDFVKDKGSAYVEVSQDVIDEKIDGVKVKAVVSGRATLEFDKNGVSDFIMEASGEAKIGDDMVKVTGDANVKWSWEAGGSGEAKGSINSKALGTAIKVANTIK